MNIGEFWRLIDEKRIESGNNPSEQAKLLADALVAMPVEAILNYQRIHDELHSQAYQLRLWNAAYIIGEGCGDDSFMDFRAWLIGQGRDIYEKALEDPENVAHHTLPEDRWETRAEDLLYVAQIAYEKKAGNEEGIPRFGTAVDLDADNACIYTYPNGDEYEACLKARYPKLWAKFGW